MTYSIVGYCEKEQAWGVAVQSKFLAVGSAVPFAKAGVGAVATQSFANTTYGPEGLRMIEQGASADEVLRRLTEADEGRADRQVGIIDANGKSATFTGEGCNDWAGGIAGKHFAAQGNILVDGNTVKEMARVFESTQGPLAERLLRALAAGQAAGGDSRGMQSAALLVVKEGADTVDSTTAILIYALTIIRVRLKSSNGSINCIHFICNRVSQKKSSQSMMS